MTSVKPLVISARYLSKLFKKETGMLIRDYINQVRVERAANLLIYSDSSLPDIAACVHFPAQKYFGKIFKHIMGTMPNEYRKTHKVNEFWMDTPPKQGGMSALKRIWYRGEKAGESQTDEQKPDVSLGQFILDYAKNV